MQEKQALAIYHCVLESEGFEETAQILFNLVREAQKKHPGEKRALYIDIEGHRNPSGGFDRDMLELQKEYICGFLLPYLTEVHIPLVKAENSSAQNNNLPDMLLIKS